MKANKGNSKSTKNSIINKTSTWLGAVTRSRNKVNQSERRGNDDEESLGMNNNIENSQTAYERPLSTIDEVTEQVDERTMSSQRPHRTYTQANTKQVYPRMVHSIMPITLQEADYFGVPVTIGMTQQELEDRIRAYRRHSEPTMMQHSTSEENSSDEGYLPKQTIDLRKKARPTQNTNTRFEIFTSSGTTGSTNKQNKNLTTISSINDCTGDNTLEKIDNTSRKIRNRVDNYEREANRMMNQPTILQAYGEQDGIEVNYQSMQPTEELNSRIPAERRRSTPKVNNKPENDHRKTSHQQVPEIPRVIRHHQPQRQTRVTQQQTNRKTLCGNYITQGEYPNEESKFDKRNRNNKKRRSKYRHEEG